MPSYPVLYFDIDTIESVYLLSAEQWAQKMLGLSVSLGGIQIGQCVEMRIHRHNNSVGLVIEWNNDLSAVGYLQKEVRFEFSAEH